ncbi:uncharacterized protein LOC111883719 [Lactuca sativa]|uniref:uncharacterized protein LOC111883719 n=1 Tax=Lactuca sativa TaxID=4236 RepID=UPI000CD8FF69|nr:uncharacterized protein LOC111883719 [Lactuca sativa]
MSIVLRCLDLSTTPIEVKEYFLGFLIVDNTTGKGLYDAIVDEIKNIGLDINDVRGQGYDNGSNMKGKHQGVQKRLLDINPRAFYTLCGCHSLNLVICDMANSYDKASEFFGVIQRIYSIFDSSTQRWKILQDNISNLTLKSVSQTRWENRVESVKAIRFQAPKLRKALLQLSKSCGDPKIKSEAKCLATYELENYQFLLGMIIWYGVLFGVNTVSKSLQTNDMCIDNAIDQLNGLVCFLEEYRENGFEKALDYAKELALEMNVKPEFHEKRIIQRIRRYDENVANETIKTHVQLFKTDYFLYVVDKVITSLKNGRLNLRDDHEFCKAGEVRRRRFQALEEEDALHDDYSEGNIRADYSKTTVDALLDIHSEALYAKDLWDTLELKYITEDASSKNFLKEFKHNLKHQKEELSLVQLAIHIRIEESPRAKENEKSDKRKRKVKFGQPSVYMLENKPRNQNHKGHGKRKLEHVPSHFNKKKKDLVC